MHRRETRDALYENHQRSCKQIECKQFWFRRFCHQNTENLFFLSRQRAYDSVAINPYPNASAVSRPSTSKQRSKPPPMCIPHLQRARGDGEVTPMPRDPSIVSKSQKPPIPANNWATPNPSHNAWPETKLSSQGQSFKKIPKLRQMLAT